MTKKSQARVARDENEKKIKAFKKHNTGWDDLKNVYLSQQGQLNAMGSTVSKFFGVKGIENYIAKNQEDYAVTIVTGFAEDMKRFQKRLVELHAQHSERSGMTDMENPTDYAMLVQLGASYNDFNTDVMTILMPLHSQVMGLMSTIENRLTAIAAMAEKAPEEQATV